MTCSATGFMVYYVLVQCMRVKGQCGMISMLHFHQKLNQNMIDMSLTGHLWIYSIMKTQYARKIGCLFACCSTVVKIRDIYLFFRHPVCKQTEWWGAGIVICLDRCADLHMAQLMPLPLTVSCFSKIQIGFTFLVPAHLSSPGQRSVIQVCVCVFLQFKKLKSLC